MLKPGDQIGDWIVEKPLGAGGMGSVFLCRGVLSSRVRSALKVLRADGAVATRERFVREVDTLAGLDHPSIVRVLSGGEDAQRKILYLFMDYVEGEDLQHRLDRGPLSLAEAYNVFRQVIGGLAHAHDRGVTHRDIKPANIMLCADGSTRIVDFGIAAAEGRTQLTREGTLPGTLPYVDPVAFQGDKPEPRKSDVYAVGLVLWECLSGRQAYPEDPEMSAGQQMASIMSRKIQAEAFDPGPAFPKELRRLVMRATAPEPDDRLADMHTFLDQLNLAFSGQPKLSAQSTHDLPIDPLPVSKKPEPRQTWHVPVDPPTRKRRSALPMVLGALVALLLLVGVAVVALLAIGVIGGGAAWAVMVQGPSTDTAVVLHTPPTPEALANDTGTPDGPTAEVGSVETDPTAGLTLSPADRAELNAALKDLGGLDEADLEALSELGLDLGVADAAQKGKLEALLAEATKEVPPVAPARSGKAAFEKPFPVSGYEVVVHGVQTLPRVQSGVMKFAAKQGWKLVVAEATVKNVSNPSGDVKFPWKFVDSYGNLHDTNHQCSMALGNGFGMTLGIPKGQRVYGRVCTELPEGTTGLKLRFQPDMMNDRQTAVVPLGL